MKGSARKLEDRTCQNGSDKITNKRSSCKQIYDWGRARVQT